MSSLKLAPQPLNLKAGPTHERRVRHGNLRQALIEAAPSTPDIERLSLRHLAWGLGVTIAAAYRRLANREELLSDVTRIGFDRPKQGFERAFDLSASPSNAAEARQTLARSGRDRFHSGSGQPYAGH
jgi:hypothetical protein